MKNEPLYNRAEIARFLGVSFDAVTSAIKKLGIESTKPKKAKAYISFKSYKISKRYRKNKEMRYKKTDISKIKKYIEERNKKD